MQTFKLTLRIAVVAGAVLLTASLIGAASADEVNLTGMVSDANAVCTDIPAYSKTIDDCLVDSNRFRIRFIAPFKGDTAPLAALRLCEALATAISDAPLLTLADTNGYFIWHIEMARGGWTQGDPIAICPITPLAAFHSASN